MEKFSGRFYVVCLILLALINSVERGLLATNPFIAALWVAVVLIHCLCAIFIWRDGVK